MFLNATTMYAIRIVYYIAQANRKVTSKELSEKMQIPVAYLLKVTRVLFMHGIITPIRGIRGGFVLEKEPSEISLGDIIKIFEDGKREPMPLDIDESLSRKVMLITKKVEQEYDATTIESLMEKHTQI